MKPLALVYGADIKQSWYIMMWASWRRNSGAKARISHSPPCVISFKGSEWLASYQLASYLKKESNSYNMGLQNSKWEAIMNGSLTPSAVRSPAILYPLRAVAMNLSLVCSWSSAAFCPNLANFQHYRLSCRVFRSHSCRTRIFYLSCTSGRRSGQKKAKGSPSRCRALLYLLGFGKAGRRIQEDNL